MKRKLKKALLLMFLLIMTSIPIYAKEIDAEVVGVEKSKAFEERENLDEKDRANSIETSYYSVDIKDSIKRSVYNSLMDTNKKEYLTEVGIGLMSTEGIEVYVNSQDGDVKNANTLVATATGTNALESGYHSLKLANPIELTGEKFVIKVKYIIEAF